MNSEFHEKIIAIDGLNDRKRKSLKKFLQQFEDKLNAHGDIEAMSYAVDRCLGHHDSMNSFLQVIDEKYKKLILQEIIERKRNKSRKNKEEKLINKSNATCKIFVEKIESDALENQFNSSVENGSEVRFLASLSPDDRKKFGTPAQRRDAVELRKSGILTSEVRAELGCSLAELNRWTEDGRLPVLFHKKINVGKSTLVRVWSRSDVEAAKLEIANWRKIRKSAKK